MIRKNTVTWSEIFILACAGNLHFLERRPKNILLKNQNSKWNNFCHVAHNVLFSSASWWSDDESASQIRLFPMNWFAVRVNRCRVRKHAGDERHKEQVGSPRDQEPAHVISIRGALIICTMHLWALKPHFSSLMFIFTLVKNQTGAWCTYVYQAGGFTVDLHLDKKVCTWKNILCVYCMFWSILSSFKKTLLRGWVFVRPPPPVFNN